MSIREIGNYRFRVPDVCHFGLGFLACFLAHPSKTINSISLFCVLNETLPRFFCSSTHIKHTQNIFLYLFFLITNSFFLSLLLLFVFRSKCITLNVSWIFFMFFFLVLAPRWIILHFCRHQTVLWHWWWRREKEISNYAADFFGSESFFPFAIFRDKIWF